MKQKISCRVYDCKFNKPLNEECSLKRIIVVCSKGQTEKDSTMCLKYTKIK